jgi:hypothetical protein
MQVRRDWSEKIHPAVLGFLSVEFETCAIRKPGRRNGIESICWSLDVHIQGIAE